MEDNVTTVGVPPTSQIQPPNLNNPVYTDISSEKQKREIFSVWSHRKVRFKQKPREMHR